MRLFLGSCSLPQRLWLHLYLTCFSDCILLLKSKESSFYFLITKQTLHHETKHAKQPDWKWAGVELSGDETETLRLWKNGENNKQTAGAHFQLTTRRKAAERRGNRPAITAKSFWALLSCCSLSSFAAWSEEARMRNRFINYCHKDRWESEDVRKPSKEFHLLS